MGHEDEKRTYEIFRNVDKIIQKYALKKNLIIFCNVQPVQQVIPSHGEGWGRPHVESMSCGVPVIATNWSGPTEYLNEENGYPLGIEEELIPAR